MKHGLALAAAALVGVCVAPAVVAQKPAPPAPSADTLLAAAMTTAAAERKAIFVDFGASWCGPCHRLDEFLHAQETKGILTSHLVLVNLTVMEDKEHKALENPGADTLMAKWGGGTAIPYYAFLDSAGNKIDADLGYPGDNASIKKFMALVDRAAPRLTSADRTTLVDVLNARSSGLGSIDGEVVDDQGRPVPKAVVSLIDRAYAEGQWRPMQGAHAETDASGHYLIEYVSAGEYRVIVEPLRPKAGAASANSPTLVTMFFGGSGRLAEAKPLVLARNQDVTGINVSLPPGRLARVSGRVSGTKGVPLANASVALVNVDWPPNSSGILTGLDGAFTLADVRPGRYNLWARAADRVKPGEGVEMAQQGIDISGDDVVNLTIAAAPGAVMSGRVRFDGPPISAADRSAIRVTAVAVRPLAGAPRGLLESRIELDGRFELRGAFGSRMIRVADLPAGWMLKAVTLAGRDVTDTAIDLPGTEPLSDLHVVVTSRAGEVGGTLKGDRGQTLKSGVVLMFADDASRWSYPSRFVRIGPVQPDGTFQLHALPAGSYLIVGTDSMPQNWDAPESLERLRARATPLRLGEAERVTVVVSLKSANR